MYFLTELVRLLEQRGHVFSADPRVAEESLRDSPLPFAERLARRAEMADRDHALRDRLAAHERRLHQLLRLATLLWLGAGFAAGWALMAQRSLNFLLLLAGVLSVHSVMLLLWLVSALGRRPPKTLLAPDNWLRGKDAVSQAMLRLYAEAAGQAVQRWRLGAAMHRLSLAALGGMALAVLLMLSVRQYGFNWESTLLDSAAFGHLVQVLGWLPAKLGFAVPDAAAVAANRNQAQAGDAAAWAGLLLGSIVCYGLLPRAAAWLFCLWRGRSRLEPDWSQPYYQTIIGRWQRRITDSAADYRADTPQPAPALPAAAAQHWALLLDTVHPEHDWYRDLLGRDWQDCGVIAERSELAALAERLQHAAAPVQLLVGIRATLAPDRGMTRRLETLSAQAAGGLIVQLYLPAGTDPAAGSLKETLAQWRDTLNRYGWPWIEPPQTSQLPPKASAGKAV